MIARVNREGEIEGWYDQQTPPDTLRVIEQAGRCIQDAGRALVLEGTSERISPRVPTPQYVEELLTNIEAAVNTIRHQLQVVERDR